MTVRLLHELYCDRCGSKFHRRDPDGWAAQIRTLQIGWFLLSNGSGSKLSTGSDRPENLNNDLCADCTSDFFDFWNAPEKSAIPANSLER